MVNAKLASVAILAASSVSAAGTPIADGVKGSITNYRQTVDTLTKQLASHDGHAAADVVSAAITGLDSQIDNGIATIASTLAPLTGGLSLAVGNALLGPFFQSVTNGAEVVLSNIIGAPIDMVSNTAKMAFANNLNNLAKLSAKYNIDSTRLMAVSDQLKSYTVKSSQQHHKREVELVARQNGAIIDGVHSGVMNAQQTVDTLVKQLQRHDGHAGADVVSAVITGLDSQIDNGIAMVSQVLSPFTGGLSMAVGNFLLGPFFQSVTNGAEVVISNVVGGGADLIAAPVRMAFANTLNRAASFGKQYNVDTTRLATAAKKLSATVPNHGKREGPIMDGVKGSVTNVRQTVDTLAKQLASHDGHAAADVISAVITGLDSQIDNGIATVTQVLAPLTGGLSLAVGNALLGPFFQSVTNGAEVVLSNLIGAPVDFVADGAAMALTRTLGNLSSFARQYNVKTDRLDAVNNQLKTLATKPSKGSHH